MITARQYEEQMQEIARDYIDQPETMYILMDKLNMDTLDCLGYAAGVQIFERFRKKEYNTDKGD